MKKNKTQVLIIGIDRYDSPSLPALLGARNDAIAWYRFVVDHLEVDPENVTVLASPPLKPQDLGHGSNASRLRGATRDEVLEEARRLAKNAASRPGLVTFAGHGLALGGNTPELALCPSDTVLDMPAGGAPVIEGVLRFSELSEIFSEECKDNVTVVLDTCYSSGPATAMRGALPASAAQASAGALDCARQIKNVNAFTTRLLLGARHWTTAHEIKVGGQWRGAASYALITLMERWALRMENGVRYPNVSHADLLDATRDFLEVLGVPQLPALWGRRRLDELTVLRPAAAPAEASPAPNAATNIRQCPIDPDKVGLISILDQNQNPILHVVVLGATVPRGITGYNARTEYWYTNTTSPPAATGLAMSVRETTSQAEIESFVSGWTESIRCAQLIGQTNWSTWSSGVNSSGRLYRASDPTRNDRYLGLYLEHNTNGTLAKYAWYRITLLADGFAYTTTAIPSAFDIMGSTDPNSMESGVWKYSLIVAPP